MKNSKFTKIIAMMAALIVLVCALAIVASAEGENLSVKINARNVSYGDLVKVLFAVDDTNAGGKEVELLYYLEDPTVNPEAKAYDGAKYDKGYTDKKNTDDTSDDVTYPSFFTAGFPAKHIGDYVYARAHIVDTDVYSAVERYSVVEYLLERLYVDRASGDKAELYKYLLGYGTYAQKVVLNGNDDPTDDVKKFINELVLVAIPGGTLDGKYAQGTYFAGDVITPSIDGAKGLNVTVFDLSTGLGETELVANGASVTVEGFTMITASEEAPESPETPETPVYKPDLNDTIGRILWSEASTPAEYKAAGYIDYWMGSDAPLEIVDGAPYGVASKVIHFGTQTHSNNQDQLFIKNTAAYANSSVAAFEADILVNPSAATQYEIRFMNSSLASADRTAYIFYLSVGVDGRGSISGSGLTSVTADGVAGNWFRLRAEYHDVSETQFRILIYFNDMLVAGSGAIDKSKGTNHASTVINQVLLAATKASVADMYIDNVKLSHAAPAFTPDFTADAKVETYEDGDALDTFRFDNNGDGAVTNGAPYGNASKVYGFTCVAGKETNFRVTNGTPVYNGTDTFVYESDVMIETASAMLIKVEFRGASLGLTMRLTTDSTGAVYLKDGSGNTITPIVPGAEWFRLRIEAKGSAVNFFINGIQVGQTQSISISGETVNRLRFYIDQGSGNLYFDNTKVLFVQ